MCLKQKAIRISEALEVLAPPSLAHGIRNFARNKILIEKVASCFDVMALVLWADKPRKKEKDLRYKEANVSHLHPDPGP